MTGIPGPHGQFGRTLVGLKSENQKTRILKNFDGHIFGVKNKTKFGGVGVSVSVGDFRPKISQNRMGAKKIFRKIFRTYDLQLEKFYTYEAQNCCIGVKEDDHIFFKIGTFWLFRY